MVNNRLLPDARHYLIEFLTGKQLDLETKHPWRKAWEFYVSHSLRVERYVLKILQEEPPQLAETEVALLRLAAVLHDIGRLEPTDNHAKLGAEIVQEWLSTHQQYGVSAAQKDYVVELIAQHSEKDRFGENFSHAVLRDADTLDEIGAMSIFMSSNWIDRQSPFFFQNLCQRLQDFEIPFCEEKFAKLNTQAARTILQAKQAFISGFIEQLHRELEADTQIEQFLKVSRENSS